MTVIEAQTPAMTTVTVDLAGRAYPIHIGSGVLDDAGAHIAPLLARPSIVVITDETVAGFHLPRLKKSLSGAGIDSRAVVLPPGEASKDFATLERLCDDLLAHRIERTDTLVALGGGVIGDLAGFAAAVVLRGIDFVQVPTSLLAQVDSSVGGKTGINTAHGKNLVGAFHQPRLVLADTAVLDTLPARQVRAGYAEIVKYALLGDRGFFAWLEDHASDLLAGDPEARLRAVETSCRAKAAIVAADERERGQRALLNLGHTFGHAFEAATGYGDRLLHGEAVALGMAMAFRFSAQLGLCAGADAALVESHLRDAGLPTSAQDIDTQLPDAAGLLALMARDKKAAEGRIALVLVRGIGEAFVTRDVPERDLAAFLEHELTQR